MSYPKYYVTYCVMDTEAGANPLGHASLIFSKQERENEPVQVIDGIGYYSQPSTTTNPFIKGVKKAISLNVDLQNGHGVLLQEKMRDLDGNGLRGVSFDINQKQFDALCSQYQQIMKTEQEVIEELNRELEEQGIVPNGQTRYTAEKEKAVRERREPRLKPFHISLKLTMAGIDSTNSYTCKDNALELLFQHEIIPEEIRNKVVSSRATTAFPIYSSLYLAPIRLISTGEPEEEKSEKTGKVFYNRQWTNNPLYWATPVYTVGNKAMDKDSEFYKNYRLIKNTMHNIRFVEHSLRRNINKIETTIGPKTEQEHDLLNQLKKHLQDVQGCLDLFINNSENQIPKLLNQRLNTVEKTLQAAKDAMPQIEQNHSFLHWAYKHLFDLNALVGLLTLALSNTVRTLLTPVKTHLLSIGLYSIKRPAAEPDVVNELDVPSANKPR